MPSSPRDSHSAAADQPAPSPEAGANGAHPAPGGGSDASGQAADQSAAADRRDGPRASSVPTPTGEDLQATIRDLDERWRRALADFDNLNKRLSREIARARSDERDRVVALLLPVVDNLELALDHATADPAALTEGIRAVRDQAVGVLGHLGFGRRDEVGVPFDPTRHEAVAVQADSGVAPGTVVRVVRPGYGNDDRQLRPAAVVVASRE
jgi:molecular chaperone GrpE